LSRLRKKDPSIVVSKVREKERVTLLAGLGGGISDGEGKFWLRGKFAFEGRFRKNELGEPPQEIPRSESRKRGVYSWEERDCPEL